MFNIKSANVATGTDRLTRAAIKQAKAYELISDLYATGQLPLKITFKVKCKYMLTKNMNTRDGLCNGTVGELKLIVKDDQPSHSMFAGDNDPNDDENPKLIVARVWIKFPGTKTGIIQRESNKDLREKDGLNKRITGRESTAFWTPFTYTQATVFRPKSRFYRIKRVQFPFIESEAITIHKSQGQSYDQVAVDLTHNNLTTRLLYVALSRCLSLSGLYLYNKESILKEKKTEALLIKLSKTRENESHRVEMRRMRAEKPFKNKFTFACKEYYYKGIR